MLSLWRFVGRYTCKKISRGLEDLPDVGRTDMSARPASGRWLRRAARSAVEWVHNYYFYVLTQSNRTGLVLKEAGGREVEKCEKDTVLRQQGHWWLRVLAAGVVSAPLYLPISAYNSPLQKIFTRGSVCEWETGLQGDDWNRSEEGQ